jgi:glycosyltransferase involved in cell wall biosynthesis
MHKVTIGLPVYNGENYLCEAVDSILAQTFGDFELIISDNASTDRTEEICRGYARQDSRIRYIRQPRNLGAVKNFNAIAAMADCEYFKWGAHDDLLHPRFLEECVDAMDSDPRVVLASPGTMLIDEDSAPLPYAAELGCLVDRQGGCYPVQPERNGDLASPDTVARFEALVLRTVLCVEIFGLIRKSALDRIPLQRSYLGSDKVFLARLCLLGPFWMGKEPFFLRRCHAQQYSAAATSGIFRSRWFGTGSTLFHGIFAEKLTFLIDYTRTILAAPLSPRQRYACFAAVARRAMTRGKLWWHSAGSQGLYRSIFEREAHAVHASGNRMTALSGDQPRVAS